MGYLQKAYRRGGEEEICGTMRDFGKTSGLNHSHQGEATTR